MQIWRSEFKRLEGAYAPATIKGYFIDFGIFAEWCEANAISPLPARPETIVAFLQAQADNKAVATLDRRLYSIRRTHRLLGLKDPTSAEDVHLAYRRIKRSKFVRPRQVKGLTSEYLRQFLDAQPNTLLGIRNRAMISLGYELLTRRSELIALRAGDVQVRPDGTLKVVIRRSKSDQFGEGRTAFTSVATAQLVLDWLRSRKLECEPLFCPVYRGKAIDRSLSDMTVRRLVKETAQRIGLPEDIVSQFSGHSFRVGAAQDLLREGYDGIAIMRAGGWKSTQTVLRYLQEAEHDVWENSQARGVATSRL
jgi:integrase/recombinase XerD